MGMSVPPSRQHKKYGSQRDPCACQIRYLQSQAWSLHTGLLAEYQSLAAGLRWAKAPAAAFLSLVNACMRSATPFRRRQAEYTARVSPMLRM